MAKENKSNSSSRPEVVVITGASAGVGRATARAFARHGAHIGLLARGHDGLEAARIEVESAGGKALVIHTDVAYADQVEAAAERVEDVYYYLQFVLRQVYANLHFDKPATDSHKAPFRAARAA